MVELPPPNSESAREANLGTSDTSEGCACGCPHAGDPPMGNHVETRARAFDAGTSLESERDGGTSHDSSHPSTCGLDRIGSCSELARDGSPDEDSGRSEQPGEHECSTAGCNHSETGCGGGDGRCHEGSGSRFGKGSGCGCHDGECGDHPAETESGCFDGSDGHDGECGCEHCEDHDGECGCEDCDCACDCDGAIDTSWLEERAPAVDTPTPEEIIELVAACIKFVRDALGFELDLSAETLPILDHYLMAARETLTDRPDLRELVWRCAGAYFGELVRRRYNGFWLLPNADAHTWRINQRQVLMSFNPVGVAAEAIFASDQAEGPTGALRLAHADQEDVSARLAQMPPLPADEYYLLSTRLEVIDTVIEHLRLRMEQNDQAEVEFDPDDYLNDLAPYGRA